MNVAARDQQVSFLPCDLDAERRVLGILIRFPDKIDEIADLLDDSLFYDPAHRKIFRAIRELYQTRGKITYTQVCTKIR